MRILENYILQKCSWFGLFYQLYFYYFGDKRIFETFLSDFSQLALIIGIILATFLVVHLMVLFYVKKYNDKLDQISDIFSCKLEIAIMGIRDLQLQPESETSSSESLESNDSSINPVQNFENNQRAVSLILKTFTKILLQSEIDLADSLMKLSLQ